MNTFLLYLLKSTLLLAVFDAFFLLVMRRSEHFRFNRIVLLSGSAACLLLPLIPIHVARPALFSVWLEPLTVGNTASAEHAAGAGSAAATTAAISWQSIFLLIYAVGALATLLFFARSYAGMFRLLRSTTGRKCEGYTLHLLAQETPSFSWLRHIVLSRSDFERYPAILTHEQAHVRFGHSRDLLLASLLAVFQWFNPLVWICRSELKLLHEYEADDFVLNQGIDATQYQLLLVKKAVGEKRVLLANGFNHAQLKNRITMMQITSKAAWKKFSLLLLLPLLGGTMLLLAECTSQDTAATMEKAAAEKTLPAAAPETKAATDQAREPVPFAKLETKPRFQDGDANMFAHWVNQNLRYPEEAREKKLQGRVTLQFTIEEDGSLTNVKVLRGVDPILDKEAVKVVSQSPKWTPGYVGEKPVRVVFNFPVVFQLEQPE